MKGFVIAGILAGLAGLVFLAVKRSEPEESGGVDLTGKFSLDR